MTLHGCYSFNRTHIVVEITLDMTPDEIDWFGFSVPEENVDEFERIVPHMEQYLTPDGKGKLCDAWDEPEIQESPTRVAFFLRKSDCPTLETPYGNIDVSQTERLPLRLKEILEFEKE
jgi:hypothetical protein